MVSVSDVVVTDGCLVTVSTLDALEATDELLMSDVCAFPDEDDPMKRSSVFNSVSGDDTVEAAVIPSKEYTEAM